MEPLQEEKVAGGGPATIDEADDDGAQEPDMTDPAPLQTLEELEMELAHIRSSNQMRKVELRVFTAHHERIRNPEEEAEELAAMMAEQQRASSRSSRGSRRHNQKSMKRASNRMISTRPGAGSPQWQASLTPLERVQISSKELEQITNESHREIDNFQSTLFKMDAETDWGENEAEDYKKMLLESRKEMQRYNDPTRELEGKLPLKFTEQRLRRLHNEKIKGLTSEMGTLTLIASSARANIKAIKLQMKQKEESGEELCAVDFQKLTIQNETIINKLGELNDEMMLLKQKMSKLGTKKEDFASSIRGEVRLNERLVGKIQSGCKHIAKTVREGAGVEVERATREAAVTEFRKRLSEVRVPSVASYINITVDIDALADITPQWQRRVDVMHKECIRYQGLWNEQRRMRLGASAFIRRASTSSKPGRGSVGFGAGADGGSSKSPRRSKPKFKSIDSLTAHPRFNEMGGSGFGQPMNSRRKLPPLR